MEWFATGLQHSQQEERVQYTRRQVPSAAWELLGKGEVTV